MTDSVTNKLEPALTSKQWGGKLPEALNSHQHAALYLYGQPFGFTWEDVDALRLHADHARLDYPHNYAIPDDGSRHPLHSLADRIAALLPPRDDA